MINTNDGHLGKPRSRVALGAPLSLQGTTAPPAGEGVLVPLWVQWPGLASGIWAVTNQPRAGDMGSHLGLSLKPGFQGLHRHEEDAMQPGGMPLPASHRRGSSVGWVVVQRLLELFGDGVMDL